MNSRVAARLEEKKSWSRKKDERDRLTKDYMKKDVEPARSLVIATFVLTTSEPMRVITKEIIVGMKTLCDNSFWLNKFLFNRRFYFFR